MMVTVVLLTTKQILQIYLNKKRGEGGGGALIVEFKPMAFALVRQYFTNCSIIKTHTLGTDQFVGFISSDKSVKPTATEHGSDQLRSATL